MSYGSRRFYLILKPIQNQFNSLDNTKSVFYERFDIITTPTSKPPKGFLPFHFTYFTYNFQIPPTCTVDSITYFIALNIRNVECKLWVSLQTSYCFFCLRSKWQFFYQRLSICINLFILETNRRFFQALESLQLVLGW